MLQIIYISQARSALAPHELVDLVARSSRRNERAGITGALYYGGGFFVQAIEGDQASVMRLYAKILDDERHHDVQLLTVRPLQERFFPAWGMGLVDASADASEGQTALRLALNCGATWNDRSFDQILVAFRRSLRATAA